MVRWVNLCGNEFVLISVSLLFCYKIKRICVSSPASYCVFVCVGPVSCVFTVTWLAGDVNEPTHLSKRVGDVVPGVVVYLSSDGFKNARRC